MVWLGCAQMAMAGEPATSGDERPAFVLPPVVIRAPRTHAGIDPTASSESVDVNLTGGLRTIEDLVAQVPGAGVRGFGGPGAASTATIRGSSSDEVVVLLDGFPITGAIGGGVDLSALPAGFLDRVDVIRGPVGALYGAGAMGGAVVLVTRRSVVPVAIDSAISIGSFGTGALSGSVVGASGQWRWLAAADFFRTAGDFPYRYDPTPELPGSAADVTTIRQGADASRAAVLGKAIFENDGISAGVLVQSTFLDRGLPSPRGALPSSARENEGNLNASARAAGSWNTLDAETMIYFRRDNRSVRGGDFPLDALERDAGVRFHSSWQAAQRHLFRFTIDGARESLLSAAFGDPARASVAVGGGWEWRMFDPLLFIAAVRAERQGDFGGVSPRAGLVIRPDSALEFRIGGGAGRRAPSFFELYYASGPLTPNPDLVPERNVGMDGGATWRFGMVSLSADAFWTRYRDLILYELYPPARVRPFNLPGATLWGGEVAAHFRRRALRAKLGYALLVSRNEIDLAGVHGNPVPYRTPHGFLGRAGWEGDRLRAFAELSAQSRTPVNRAATVFLATRTLVNAGASIRLGAGFWIGAEVSNLLDQQTLEEISGYPLPGRAVNATLRWESSTPTEKESS